MTRKLLTIITITLISTNCALAQFRYGPTIGVSMNNLHFKQDIVTIDKTVGYSAGITGEMMFPGLGFGVDISLFYEQRGATMHLGEKLMWSSQGYGKERAYLHYAVIPMHLRFKYTRLNGFEDKLAPFVYAGPSFGFLVGHSKIDAMKYAVCDFGIDMGIGAEIFRHWQLSISYNLGLTYALKDKILTDYSARNRGWAIRLAYLF